MDSSENQDCPKSLHNPCVESETSKTLQKVCEECSSNQAAIWCENCTAFICKNCDLIIHSFGTSIRHKRCLVAIWKNTKCTQHNEDLKIFCLSCNEVVCYECMTFGDHKGHETDLLSRFAKVKRNELGAFLARVGNSAKILRSMLENVKKTQIELGKKELEGSSNLNQAKNSVKEHMEQLSKFIQNRQCALISYLDSYAASKTSILENQQKKLEEVISLADAKSKIILEALSYSDLDIGNRFYSLKETLESFVEFIENQYLAMSTPAVDSSVPVNFDMSIFAAIENVGQFDDDNSDQRAKLHNDDGFCAREIAEEESLSMSSESEIAREEACGYQSSSELSESDALNDTDVEAFIEELTFDGYYFTDNGWDEDTGLSKQELHVSRKRAREYFQSHGKFPDDSDESFTFAYFLKELCQDDSTQKESSDGFSDDTQKGSPDGSSDDTDGEREEYLNKEISCLRRKRQKLLHDNFSLTNNETKLSDFFSLGISMTENSKELDVLEQFDSLKEFADNILIHKVATLRQAYIDCREKNGEEFTQSVHYGTIKSLVDQAQILLENINSNSEQYLNISESEGLEMLCEDISSTLEEMLSTCPKFTETIMHCFSQARVTFDQAQVGFVCSEHGFEALVAEIGRTLHKDVRWTCQAIAALQTASEAFIIECFSLAQYLATYYRQDAITIEDVRLASCLMKNVM